MCTASARGTRPLTTRWVGVSRAGRHYFVKQLAAAINHDTAAQHWSVACQATITGYDRLCSLLALTGWQTNEAEAMDTEAQMKAAQAEEQGGAGGSRPGSVGGSGEAEEMVPAEVDAALLKQMEEMVGAGWAGCLTDVGRAAGALRALLHAAALVTFYPARR